MTEPDRDPIQAADALYADDAAGVSEERAARSAAQDRYALWDSSVQGVGPTFDSPKAAARFRAAQSSIRQLDLTLVRFDDEEGAWVDA